jgi:hypothetical protein
MAFGDGTFSRSPNQFYQLYTIHGIVFNSVFPLIYIFLTRKTKALYIKVLTYICDIALEYKIELILKIISLDFEQATIEAYKTVWPNIQIQCCLFHFAQSKVRKADSLGLRSDITSN